MTGQSEWASKGGAAVAVAVAAAAAVVDGGDAAKRVEGAVCREQPLAPRRRRQLQRPH